jgi:predicted DCC family thiol-disulfide oxidoreductase YuxK
MFPAMTELARSPSPLLLYDGLCGFCHGAVRFILRRDPSGSLCFAPLQGPTGQAVLARHPELEGVDSLVFVERAGGRETAVVRSEAVLRIAAYLGGVWAWSAVLRLVPEAVRDGTYALIARSRYRVFGRYESCPAPAPEVRDRFLP